MSRFDYRIAVVGVGAVGVSMIVHLVRDLIARKAPPTKILAFERSGVFGPGAAYRDDDRCAILNRTGHTMSVSPDEPGDFVQWLAGQRTAHAPDDYLPRPLFGDYLRATLGQAMDLAAGAGHCVVPVSERVETLEHQAGCYLLVGARGAWQTDYVILATGNLPQRHYRHLLGLPGYFHSPYPLRETIPRIPPECAVAIVGSRLSAIDAVVALHRHGHRGAITLLSRQGYLPGVQRPQGNAALRYCTANRVRALRARMGGRLSLHMVLRLVLKELSLSLGARFSVKARKPAGGDAVAALRRDLQATCRAPQPWQAAFVALNAVIGDLWQALSPADRARFRRYGYSRFMAIRVPIPLANAQVLDALFQAGQLALVPGLEAVTHRDGAFVARVAHGEERRFDVLVNATAPDNDVACTEDPLFDTLHRQGLVQAHPLGGVEVDFETNEVQGPGRLYVIGNLTSGVHFFCGVYESNTRHCRRVSLGIVDDLLRRQPARPPRHPHEAGPHVPEGAHGWRILSTT